MSELKPAASDWDQLFAQLRSRFPKATDSVLFCINELQQGAEVPLDDLKAQGAMHGIRVTGASLNAARRLLAPPVARQTERVEPVRTERPRREHKRQPQHAGTDFEGLLRDAVSRMTAASDARAERLENAVRAAIEILRAALDQRD